MSLTNDSKFHPNDKEIEIVFSRVKTNDFKTVLDYINNQYDVISYKETKTGRTLLFYACFYNNRGITELLLSLGADPLQLDLNNNTVLDFYFHSRANPSHSTYKDLKFDIPKICDSTNHNKIKEMKSSNISLDIDIEIVTYLLNVIQLPISKPFHKSFDETYQTTILDDIKQLNSVYHKCDSSNRTEIHVPLQHCLSTNTNTCTNMTNISTSNGTNELSLKSPIYIDATSINDKYYHMLFPYLLDIIINTGDIKQTYSKNKSLLTNTYVNTDINPNHGVNIIFHLVGDIYYIMKQGISQYMADSLTNSYRKLKIYLVSHPHILSEHQKQSIIEWDNDAMHFNDQGYNIITLLDSQSRSLLYDACRYQDEDLVNFLLDNGINIWQQDSLGDTIFEYYLFSYNTYLNPVILTLLTNHGANGLITNAFDQTSIMIIVECPAISLDEDCANCIVNIMNNIVKILLD